MIGYYILTALISFIAGIWWGISLKFWTSKQ